MFTGQVLVFMLILQASFAIEAYLAEVSRELDRLSMLSLMGTISENAMLDCCMRLRSWSTEDPGATAELIPAMAEEWEKSVEEYLGTVGVACELSLGSILVEPLTNQTLDDVQMGFLGTNGSGRIFLSAVLIVSLEAGSIQTEAAYPIRIAS